MKTNENTSEETGTESAKVIQAFTFVGVDEYYGECHIYDGCSEAQATGSVAEVVAYLRGIVIPPEDALKWQGRNGSWYSGESARALIAGEIATLQDGSHPSLREEED